MKAPYLPATSTTEVWTCLTRLRARTVVFDVEPLVASWDTDQVARQDGTAAVLDAVVGAGTDTVVFATNSARRLPTPPAAARARVSYVASAAKPLRVGTYRHLPHPGVVIGDQIATDGVLAWRLGYTFIHSTPGLATIPLGPRLMRQIGRPIRPLLFRNT